MLWNDLKHCRPYQKFPSPSAVCDLAAPEVRLKPSPHARFSEGQPFPKALMISAGFTEYLPGEAEEWAFLANLKTNRKVPGLPWAELLPHGSWAPCFPTRGWVRMRFSSTCFPVKAQFSRSLPPPKLSPKSLGDRGIWVPKGSRQGLMLPLFTSSWDYRAVESTRLGWNSRTFWLTAAVPLGAAPARLQVILNRQRRTVTNERRWLHLNIEHHVLSYLIPKHSVRPCPALPWYQVLLFAKTLPQMLPYFLLIIL